MTKSKALETLKSELLAEFEKKFFRGTRKRCHSMKHVPEILRVQMIEAIDKELDWLSHAIDTIAEKTAEAVEVENDSEYISEIGWSNHPELAYRGGKKFGFNQAVYRQSLKRDKWLGKKNDHQT